MENMQTTTAIRELLTSKMGLVLANLDLIAIDADKVFSLNQALNSAIRDILLSSNQSQQSLITLLAPGNRTIMSDD